MKLYYYDKTKNFHCYTQCGENFNIIELYHRYMILNHQEIPYRDCEDYIRQYVCTGEKSAPRKEEKVIKNETAKKVDFISLPAYNENVLDLYVDYPHPLWKKDGITEEAMRHFGIRFSIQQNKIIIPHRDIDGRLIGLRARAIEPEDIALGKYMPVYDGGQLYNHQLGFNLYGIYEHKEAIQKLRRVIIFESEKSVLLSDGFYGKYSTAVATCGSQLNKFQINLLTKKLGVNDIILAYDKEYIKPYSEEGKKYRQRLIDKCIRYRGLANFYYIFDERGLLQQKDAPCDRGQEIYENLLKRKIAIV